MLEFKQRVLAKYDCVTIGEVGGGITPEQSLKLSGYQDGSINMVFNFDTAWQNGAFGSIDKKDDELVTDVVELKKNFLRWYNLCNGKAWLPLYWTNHDHPRVVSQYGNIKYREASAKMLITVLLFMYGTPFIYYGDEIGMSNVDYQSLEDFNDVGARNYLKENANRFTEEQFLRHLRRTSRVNNRTPMQWSDEPFAGFSNVTPSQRVNGNYREVNVRKQLGEPHSIFNFYRRAIALRKTPELEEAVLNGSFSIIDINNKDAFVYAHERPNPILVIANFRARQISFPIDCIIKRVLLHNYDDELRNEKEVTLRPFECYLLSITNK
jgi:glycosidase